MKIDAWLVHYVMSGFAESGCRAALFIFTRLFATANLLKFVYDIQSGTIAAYRTGFCGFNERSRGALSAFMTDLFVSRYVVGARFFGAVLLAAHVLDPWCLIILWAGFILEYGVRHSNHLSLYVLISTFLLLDAVFHGDWWHLIPSANAMDVGDLFSQSMIVVTMVFMYVFTAIRKMNEVFVSGAVVYTTLQREFKHSSPIASSWFFKNFVFAPENKLQRKWKPLMIATIAVELTLPFLLLKSSTFLLGAILGISLHLSFLILGPFRLSHFSLVSISTYLLFLDPIFFCRHCGPN